MVAEFESVVSVVTDSLRSLPPALDASKQRPSQVRQLFGVAVTTCQQVGEDVTGQIGYVPLSGRRAHLIRQAAVLDDKIAANFEQFRWGDKPGADVAVGLCSLKNDPGVVRDFHG
jgi:hypothetical protein